MQHLVYLGLGSNLGNRKTLIRQAIGLLGERVGGVVRQSSLLETEPWGFTSSHKFVNACVACQTEHTPREVLAITQEIEREMGRREKSHDGIYHDRTIDIDILLYDHLHLQAKDLSIPHPKMFERDFVMKPLREICPDLSTIEPTSVKNHP
ncbi:MAG: 2-amino-4-hydroxy-6-hydroxymethyldihydropteridine diphosphokinase [Prevotella sp.]|nr:2-amino-4-hydroxy-6-hydroxymethyldihydropteridine diphosphokinase [Prevotella sp.]